MRALVLALLSACAPGPRTAALATTATTLVVMDWAQTRRITAACQEQNPIIGKCGENVPLALYFPVALAATLTGLGLRDGWRDAWFGVIVGAEASTVVSNWAAGY